MMLKALRILAVALLALALLLSLSWVGGIWWLEHRFLKKEIPLGPGSLRVFGGNLTWDLQFRSDSVWYRSPSVQARLGKTGIGLDLFQLGFPPIPAIEVETDTAFVRLIQTQPPDTLEATKPMDSLAFPDVKSPVRAVLNIRALALENDSGALVSMRSVRAAIPGAQRADLEIGALRSPASPRLEASFSARLDWSFADSVGLEAEINSGEDRVRLETRHPRSDLLRGRARLRARAADSRAYAEAFGFPEKPFAQDASLDVRAARGDSLEARALLQARASGFPDSLPLRLSPQDLEVRFDWSNVDGSWNVHSRGQAGEELDLTGTIRELPAAPDSLPHWNRFAASALGIAKGFRVHAGGKTVRTEVRLEKAEWDGRGFSVNLRTGDASGISARARQTREGWSGDFSVQVRPGERWVEAFLDTNISFDALAAEGRVEGKTVSASLSAHSLYAYGVRLDSLASGHVYGPGGYDLESSRLYAGEDVWFLSGSLKKTRPVPSVRFRLESPEHGSLEFSRDRMRSLRITARGFEVGAFPFEGLARLPVQNPALDADFQWNPKRRVGSLKADASADVHQERIRLTANARWDAQILEARDIRLQWRQSSLVAAARLNLRGKQFYELHKLRIPDYEYLSLETPGLDLAGATALFRAQPVLKGGDLRGGLSYEASRGFQGSLAFSGVAPNSELPLILKRLQLDGKGDTLLILANTESETMPLLRDSVRIALTHALENRRAIRLDAVAADSLRLRLDAVLSRSDSLRGTLSLGGRAVLPENSGRLEELRVEAGFFLPFRNAMEGAAFTTSAFEGDYILPAPMARGVPMRQHFSLSPSLRDGTARIPDFRFSNEKGQVLEGQAEYALKGRRLRADFKGGDFGLQWTENRRAALRDFRLELASDSGGTRIGGGFSQGSLLYVDPPLHAEGVLKDASFVFAQPPAGPRREERKPASLEFSGTLSQSLVRYRLKSIAALQALFQGERGRKGGGGRARPIRLDVNLRTVGDSNRVDSEILRLSWVGDLEMRGVYPFTLARGRVNALRGELGFGSQAYQISRLEVKWLNAPLEEGEAELEARKNLASSCNGSSSSGFTASDSCTVITRLEGPLRQLQFSYDTDCGGAYGAGASVAALIYSVQRGCYDPAFAAGGGGPGYGEKALSLLEPTLSRGLSRFVGQYTSWIAETEITGLGSLANRDSARDSLSRPLSLQITSKEFLRLRLKIRSGYHVESQDLSNPWQHMLALEWRPPLAEYVENPVWKRRLHNHINVTASVETRPARRNQPREDEVEQKLGLNYGYDFWGFWWNKARQPAKETSGSPEEKK